MTYILLSTVVALVLVVLKCVQLYIRDVRLDRIMPPSPPGLPLLGNIFQVPPQQWFQLVKWKEQYGASLPLLDLRRESAERSSRPGSIFSLNLAGQRVVVLNDFASAAELIGTQTLGCGAL